MANSITPMAGSITPVSAIAPQAGMVSPQAIGNSLAAGGRGTTGNNFTQRLQNIINRASNPQGEIQVIGQTKIIADERTNSLLIFASKEDMKTIKEIISKLDIVLPQVGGIIGRIQRIGSRQGPIQELIIIAAECQRMLHPQPRIK